MSYLHSSWKWLGMGMVLCNPTHHQLLTKEGCGQTTGMNATEATKAIASVLRNLNKTTANRELVLTGLHTSEKEAWGKGLLIFVMLLDTNQLNIWD